MAGDWIKMRGSLCTHPKVLQMADLLAQSPESTQLLLPGLCSPANVTHPVTGGDVLKFINRSVLRDVCLAALLRVWCAANEHTTRGVFANVTLTVLDDLSGIPGFGRIMQHVGWALVDDKKRTVRLPNFLKFNVPSKARAEDPETRELVTPGALRMRRLRARRSDGSVTPDGDAAVTPRNGQVTPIVTDREEESRVLLTPSPRVRLGRLVTVRPDEWPQTEAQARSMAETAGVPPDLAATYWHHHESLEEWPPGSFASFIKAKAGFKAQDLSDKKAVETTRAALRDAPAPDKKVTTTAPKNGW